jgi:hypothetical protein
MPSKVVDLSARSRILRDEPFHLHFWELGSVEEAVSFLRNPREELAKIGIKLPDDCRIETTIENHDWLSAHTSGLRSNNGTIICNVGGGNVAKNFYKVSMYAHDVESVGKFTKELLHAEHAEERTRA